jgi:hypothetical protein
VEPLKSTTIILIVILIASALSSSAIPSAKAAAVYGPRVDQLLCKIYPNSTDEFTAFQDGQVDIIDWPLTKTWVTVINNTPGYALDKFKQFSLFEFDLNNNQTVVSYPGIQIPTFDKNFRIAMAYMVDKPYIINTIVGGYGVRADAPIMPWLPWYDPLLTTYSYNPALACQTLFNNGWRSSADPNVVANVHFPATWPQLPGGPNVAGQDLVTVFNKTDVGFGAGSGPGIIFLRRSDDPNRSGAGYLLMYGDSTHQGLVSIGIPVDDFDVPRATCSLNVMYRKNFMVYTGDWKLSRNPDYVYDLFHPDNYNSDPNIFARNYDHVNDTGLNAAEFQIKLAPTTSGAQMACRSFCDIWGTIQPMICLWASSGYYAHRTNVHTLRVDWYNIPSFFDLLCMNIPSVGVTGGTVNFGFASDVQMLNVINSQWVWDWQILGEIYDTLISYNPWNVGIDMPWMATSWTVGSWIVPSSGTYGTEVTYVLNRSINFVNPVTGTVYAPVTPEDVAFSIQYTYGQQGWNAPSLFDCFTNSTSAPWSANSGFQIPFVKTGVNSLGQSQVTAYFKHLNAWAVDCVGNIPIFPKAIFEPITDATGFYPGGDTNVAAMTGSGPFYFSSYNPGVSCSLLANRNYFAPIVPNSDNDPTNIHLDWGLFISNTDYRWNVTYHDIMPIIDMLGSQGPYPGWIPADVNKDGRVTTLDMITVATDFGARWLSDTWGTASVTSVTCDKDGGLPIPVVCQKSIVYVSVSMINNGFEDEFTVKLYANETLIGSENSVLVATYPRQTSFTFSWNATGLGTGKYILRAVPEYGYSLNGSTVFVAKSGDVNYDGAVNLLDLIIVAKALSVYNPSADVIHDHTINVLDLISVAYHLGT